MNYYTKVKCLLVIFVLFATVFYEPDQSKAAGIVTDCSTYGPGLGTLEEAIAGGGEISFACSGTIIVPEILISVDTSISGYPQNVILSGNHTNRIFSVASPGIQFTLNGLTLRDGLADFGGAIINYGGLLYLNTVFFVENHATQGGGAIYNWQGGDLTLFIPQFIGNEAGFGGAFVNNASTVYIQGGNFRNNKAADGGTIHTYGPNSAIRIFRTLFNNNTGTNGGVIYNGSYTLIGNSTFSNNHADIGGAINNRFDGTLEIQSDTIFNNQASISAGGIHNDNGIVTIASSIVAKNTNGQCGGSSIISNNYNISGDGTCDFTQTYDYMNTDPLLGPLTNNGGRNLSHALLFGSPALDASADCPYPYEGRDGLTFNRTVDLPTIPNIPGGSGCDIGSFEAQTLPAAAVISNTSVEPPVPLCSDFTGATNSIVRASLPLNVYGVFCRVIAENGNFVVSSAEIGIQSVLDRGVIQAVDVFSPNNSQMEDALICLQGIGDILFLSYANAPRIAEPIQTEQRDGYTCAHIATFGIVALVNKSNSTNVVTEITIPLINCQVVTTHQVRLRAQPNLSGEVITTLPYQLQLTATAKTEGWYQVIYSNTQGWVSAVYLDTIGDC